jgi:cyclopropane-fatty-acyl-phospholipid synthase
METKYRKIAEEILATTQVTINGNQPWDIRVHNDAFYRRVLTEGDMGIGEAYMEGWWDSERVDELISKILEADLSKKVSLKWSSVFLLLQARLLNLQTKRRALMMSNRHYDLGNELFQKMLDPRMNYSCAYWKNAETLEQAQENKLDLICRKLNLQPGMKVLDIGCGWGAFGKFAAEKYQVKVVGITVSKEQVKLGQKLSKGLPVEFRLMDYRALDGKFDRIVSVGMIEHVGYKNYNTFFKTASNCLAEGGLFLLHTIGSNRSVKSISAWTNKYIFPNAMLPSMAQLSKASEGLFVMEDVHNFGKYYDDTLMAWHHNFKKSWNQIEKNYPPYFYRMWEYYLLSSAASFRTRQCQLWQIVLSKNGVPGGYDSIR